MDKAPSQGYAAVRRTHPVSLHRKLPRARRRRTEYQEKGVAVREELSVRDKGDLEWKPSEGIHLSLSLIHI